VKTDIIFIFIAIAIYGTVLMIMGIVSAGLSKKHILHQENQNYIVIIKIDRHLNRILTIINFPANTSYQRNLLEARKKHSHLSEITFPNLSTLSEKKLVLG
jgi:hypothetical protein